MSQVVPIRDIARRLPIAGRIRTGTKSAKGFPTKLSTFRFTSSDQHAIEQIAQTYGGTVEQWPSGPTDGQWQVTTNANEVSIMLPPDPLGGTPIYELWSGGGCMRRCDGETAEIPQSQGDTADLVETPCICAAKGELECSVKTRLLVLLPDIKFAGAWRIDTGSMAAAQELPGMVDTIQMLQARGMVRGLLGLEQRQSQGGRRKFAVPVLRLAESIDAIAAGSDGTQSLGRVDAGPAIEAPQTSPEAGASAPPVDSEASPAPESAPASPPTITDGQRRKFMAHLRDLGLDYENDVRAWVLENGKVESLNDLPRATMVKWLDRLSTDEGAAAFAAAVAPEAEVVEPDPVVQATEVVAATLELSLGSRIEALGLDRVDVLAKADELRKPLKASAPDPRMKSWSEGSMHPKLYAALDAWVAELEQDRDAEASS